MAKNTTDNLIELLRAEQELALRRSPFKCIDIECIHSGRHVYPGDCRCYDMQATEHRSKVRRALEIADREH